MGAWEDNGAWGDKRGVWGDKRGLGQLSGRLAEA